MGTEDKILQLMRVKGPIMPSQVSKEINSDIIIASAHLSELSSKNKVKISSLKIGSTPLYYLAGQEASLQNFSNYLHEKEKKAFGLLKEKKILRDSKLEPVTRVALREIKDFAVPLQVTYQNNNEIFWKWYILTKEESHKLIKSLLTGKETEEKKETKIEQKPETRQKALIEKEDGVPVKKETKEKPKETKAEKTSVFLEETKSYFNRNKIIIKSFETIKKNAEIDFILEVPSGIGNLEYYCKTKNKKRISGGDLSSAYVQGQLKKLPVLFLTKGELTKKAKEMLNKEFKNIKLLKT